MTISYTERKANLAASENTVNHLRMIYDRCCRYDGANDQACTEAYLNLAAATKIYDSLACIAYGHPPPSGFWETHQPHSIFLEKIMRPKYR